MSASRISTLFVAALLSTPTVSSCIASIASPKLAFLSFGSIVFSKALTWEVLNRCDIPSGWLAMRDSYDCLSYDHGIITVLQCIFWDYTSVSGRVAQAALAANNFSFDCCSNWGEQGSKPKVLIESLHERRLPNLLHLSAKATPPNENERQFNCPLNCCCPIFCKAAVTWH